MAEEIFWLDGFEGECKGGFFVRNPLFEFLEKCEKQGLRVVGIKKPTDYNLELIMEAYEYDGHKKMFIEKNKKGEKTT